MMGYDVTEKLEEYKANAKEETSGWGSRGRLVNRLTEEAQAAHKTGRYETSLDKFVHLLALVETDPSTTKVSETRATITSNIGSALHFLGETALAKEFYERALEEFGKARMGWLSWLKARRPKSRLSPQARFATVSCPRSSAGPTSGRSCRCTRRVSPPRSCSSSCRRKPRPSWGPRSSSLAPRARRCSGSMASRSKSRSASLSAAGTRCAGRHACSP